MARTREQIAQDKLIPAKEIVPFEVIDATDGQSKNGDPMTSLRLKAFYNDREFIIRDWLGFWTRGDEKVMQFCDASGLDYSKYSKMDRPPSADDVQGITGYIKVNVRESEQFGDSNQVSVYVPAVDADFAKERSKKEVARAIPSSKFATVPVSDIDADLPF